MQSYAREFATIDPSRLMGQLLNKNPDVVNDFLDVLMGTKDLEKTQMSLMERTLTRHSQYTGGTAPLVLDSSAFTKLMAEKSDKLFRTWAALHSAYQTYEGEITKRWGKMRLL